ncbi:unnamed protein product [Lymnaea stagnalis]|uniref:Small ribosomal subunit protein mS39 n=1 Tax=Lymnaea stagnalis TaxID=6523 RepID=A0AAV2IEI5_LYMST
MAAALRQQAKVTMPVSRALLFDIGRRYISIGRPCCGNTWHIFRKIKKKNEFIPVTPPIELDKSVKKGEVINIPDKIERSPTAILSALASTVRNDLNQPMYLSIDDPYLYLNNDRAKKFAMASMDSGRNAAKLMLSEYKEYMTQMWEEPLPEVWRDINKGYVHKDASEAALLERISKRHVTEAIQVYTAMKAKEPPLSQEAQEKLLELLTVFNCEDPETQSELHLFIEPPMLTTHSPFPLSTWKKGNMAEQVFNSLPEKTCKAYCYMLRGMAKHYDKESALNLYNEMKAAKMTADVYTFNLLLKVSSLDAQSVDEIRLSIESLLKDMSAGNVRPNVETFNSILCNCRRVSRWTGSKMFALAVLSEMKACDIEPNLATYNDVLNIFYYSKSRDSSPQPKSPDLFENILEAIENKEFIAVSEGDYTFFRSAMRVVVNSFPDSKYALRLHKVLQHGKNSDLLGHRQLQYGYYNDLFNIIVQLEHTDVVMELYQQVVPYIFLPSSEIYHLIFENISLHETYHYLPQIYIDLETTAMFFRNDFLLDFFRLVAHKKHEPQLQSQMCDITESLIKSWLMKRERQREYPAVDGAVLGEMILIYLYNEDDKKAWELFQMYQKDHTLRATNPSEKSLIKLTEHMIAAKDYDSTKQVLTRMLELECGGIPALVDKTLQAFELSEQERNYLEGVASDAASEPSSDSSSSSDNGSSSDSD